MSAFAAYNPLVPTPIKRRWSLTDTSRAATCCHSDTSFSSFATAFELLSSGLCRQTLATQFT